VLLVACPGPQPTFVEAPVSADVEVTPGTATLTWRKGLNASETLVVRTLGSVEATRPVGRPVVGDGLGGGTVVYVGDAERHVDRSFPDSCGPFAWHLWSLAADGTWSAEARTVRSLRGAHTLPPSAQVTNLSAVTEGGVLRLRWVVPDASTGFQQVAVVRKVGSAPANSTDGALVYAGPSAMTTDALSNLSPTAETYYAVFNCNACGRCADGAPSVGVGPPSSLDAGTTDGGMGDAGVDLSLTGFMAILSADRQRVELSWSTTAPSVRVLRRLNGTPTGPTDTGATVVFDGAGTTARERTDALLPNTSLEARTYTYAAWACSGATCSSQPGTATFTLTLTQALQGGGYVISWRHASASTCNDNTALGPASTTTVPDWWKSCDSNCATATARQLTSPQADDEMNAVRTYFASRGITVSRVLSSEYCRCFRTAEGFHFGPSPELRQELTYFVYAEANRCADTYALLNQVPAAGTNTALVTHAGYPQACAILDGLAWGEAAIFKPVPGGQPRYIARVLASGWASLP
jgi:hypothetical protein